MKDFIIVFSEEDKKKLTKGLIFIGNQGNGYIFKDNGLSFF